MLNDLILPVAGRCFCVVQLWRKMRDACTWLVETDELCLLYVVFSNTQRLGKTSSYKYAYRIHLDACLTSPFRQMCCWCLYRCHLVSVRFLLPVDSAFKCNDNCILRLDSGLLLTLSWQKTVSPN